MALGVVIRTFASPSANPRAVGWDGRNLVVIDGSFTYIYYIAAWQYALPNIALGTDGQGCCVVGTSLFVTFGNSIRQYSLDSGQLIRSWTVTARGIAWDGAHFWVGDAAGTLFCLDPETFETIRSFTVASTPRGIAWDGSTLWVVQERSSGNSLVNQYDPATEKLIRTFTGPETDLFGLVWDGYSLWACGSSGNRIYQMMAA